ncbi:MAG: hypothetical protein NWF14_02835 [Candidatus Bathyarchaeota archaeon]|nr:hypothetical protein [Candidatus Bathyarchaeota archaeon]
MMRKIGGDEAYRVLRSFFIQYSNAYEYQYVRGGAALGLALVGGDSAVQLLLEARKRPPSGMETQFGWISRSIDEALMKLGVEPPETWDRVAIQFISEIKSGTPDFKRFAENLGKFNNVERGAAWNAVAQEYDKRGEKGMAQRCWLEALYNNSLPCFVTPWTCVEFPSGSAKNMETVDKIRKKLGPLVE